MNVTLSTVITDYKKLKDRSFKLTIQTSELTPEQLLWIDQLTNVASYTTIGLNPVSFDEIKDDLPKVLDKEVKTKSPSQRLRGVLYRLWEMDRQWEFEQFYDSMMEKIIDHYKSKLD